MAKNTANPELEFRLDDCKEDWMGAWPEAWTADWMGYTDEEEGSPAPEAEPLDGLVTEAVTQEPSGEELNPK